MPPPPFTVPPPQAPVKEKVAAKPAKKAVKSRR
jgi:hypothetical protein